MKDIFTERLILRNFKKDDLLDTYEITKSDLVGPKSGWLPHTSIEETKKLVNLFIEEDFTLAIVLKNENKVIGYITFSNSKPDPSLNNLSQKEVGYVLNPNYFGLGYAPEALKAILNYLFKETNTDLVWAYFFDNNMSSKRVLEKCGFNYKFSRDSYLLAFNNREITDFYYSISREEYLNS